MIFQAFLEVLAEIIGAIILFLKPIVVPIGEWMVGWITAVIDFFQQTFSNDLTLFITICVILVVAGIFINIIWPGDRPGTIFSKGIEKYEDFGDKITKEEGDIVESVRRCKDCGNPIGDAEVCPLCGARN